MNDTLITLLIISITVIAGAGAYMVIGRRKKRMKPLSIVSSYPGERIE